jgi:isoleucyl-tRNA synthetase
LNDALLSEGFAREVVNKVNTMRREEGFQVSDRIQLYVDTTEIGKRWIETYLPYIQEETLTVKVHFQHNKGTEWNLNGERAVIQIEKVVR